MRIRFDDDINAYEGFFDHQWAKQFSSLVESTKLNDAAFNLCAELKGISNARRLPWLMMNGLKDSIDSALNTHTPFPLQVIQGLIERIATQAENHHIFFSTQDRAALCSEVQEIESQITQELSENPANEDLNQIWSTYLQEPEFLLAIWMSEINSFRSIYFAYENFLIKVVEIATRKQGLRADDLNSELPQLLGEKVLRSCWTDEAIDLPRLIRHSLVHNGFKPSGELGSKYNGKFQVENGTIVIMAHHTNQLFLSVKEKILVFATEAIKLDSLKLKTPPEKVD